MLKIFLAFVNKNSLANFVSKIEKEETRISIPIIEKINYTQGFFEKEATLPSLYLYLQYLSKLEAKAKVTFAWSSLQITYYQYQYYYNSITPSRINVMIGDYLYDYSIDAGDQGDTWPIKQRTFYSSLASQFRTAVRPRW